MKVQCGICKAKFDEEDKEGMTNHFMEQHQAEVAAVLDEQLADWFEECD